MTTKDLVKLHGKNEAVKIILEMVNNGIVPIEKIIEYNGKLIIKLNGITNEQRDLPQGN